MKGYPSDRDLVRQALAGDLRAFETIVERHQQAVHRIIYRLLKDQQEAEDLAQEAFIKCYQNLSQYDQARPFTPWFYRIATNLALSKLRRRKIYQFISWDQCFNWITETKTGGLKNQRLSLASRNAANFDYMDPEAAWEEEETKEEIVRAIKRLKPLDQLVIILRYFEELSYEEIALILQTNRNNIEVRLYRARKRLRTILRGEQASGKKEKQAEEEVKTCSRAGK